MSKFKVGDYVNVLHGTSQGFEACQIGVGKIVSVSNPFNRKCVYTIEYKLVLTYWWEEELEPVYDCYSIKDML